MDKTIGDKTTFAIQYKITDISLPYAWGNICYWIDGVRLGDFSKTTIVSDSFVHLPQIIKDSGHREHEVFFSMKKEEVYYFLGGQAYSDDYGKYEQLALEETWARFNISLGLDVFSNTNAYLIDNDNKSRIVFKDNNETLHESFLPRWTADKAFSQFYDELDAIC